MISAAPPVLAIEGDSAWIVIIAVSLVTLPAVLLSRRLIDRPGGLASGLLLSLPLSLPLVAAVWSTSAVLPVVAVLRPVDESVLRKPGALIHVLWTQMADGRLVPYTLWDTAGAWMLWIGLSVSTFMLIRRAVGTVLVYGLIRHCRPLDVSTEAHVSSAVDHLSGVIGLARSPRVLVMPDEISGAFAVGGRRARILISKDLIDGLDEAELRAILAHEIAHIDAHDISLTFAAGSLRDLVAWNPVAHLAFRRLMVDREIEADRRAAEMTGDPLAVASGLIRACELSRLIPGRKRRLALAFLGTGGRVKRRVGALLALADGHSIVRASSHAPYLAAAVLVAALGLHTGARIAAQDEGAFAIVWGSTDQPTEGFWSPHERRLRQAEEGRARPMKKTEAFHFPQIVGGAAVKQKHIPEWLLAARRVSRRAGLSHEFQQWQFQPTGVLTGPISVYRLLPEAI
ncbi:MAG: M56 family metallopeptidase [Actinomycetota bacterium]